MDDKADQSWMTFNRIINILLAVAAAVALASVAWGLDVADVVPEWTQEGKTIAMERARPSVAVAGWTVPRVSAPPNGMAQIPRPK